MQALAFSYHVSFSWEISHSLHCCCHTTPAPFTCRCRDLVSFSVSDSSLQLFARHPFQFNTSKFKCIICSPNYLLSHLSQISTLPLSQCSAGVFSGLSYAQSLPLLHPCTFIAHSGLFFSALFPIPSAASTLQNLEACGATGNMEANRTDSKSNSTETYE